MQMHSHTQKWAFNHQMATGQPTTTGMELSEVTSLPPLSPIPGCTSPQLDTELTDWCLPFLTFLAARTGCLYQPAAIPTIHKQSSLHNLVVKAPGVPPLSERGPVKGPIGLEWPEQSAMARGRRWPMLHWERWA